MGNLRFRHVHLDFHTSEKIDNIAHHFDAAEFAETLKKSGVNSINCFAKCHHGMIYYDTKFPAKHPGLKRDLLKEQVDACHEAGIRVPIYLSVAFDEYMAYRHPEWLERSPEGKPTLGGPLDALWKKICLNTNYVDYLEEQVHEIFEKFGDKVDGIWFDIVDQLKCCCKNCLEDMERDGLNPVIDDDRRKNDEKVILKFKQRMSSVIRAYKKDCPIFYNSGHIGPAIRKSLDTYSHLELESLPSGGWGYEHFPVTVRYARNLGVEYLGMTGRFHKSWADFGGIKNQPALEYECFSALANGAKCCVGDQLHPSGAINKGTYELIGSVYNKVKEKEGWCDDVRSVTDIGVFTPEAILGGYKELHRAVRGAYRMLTEAHYQFDIIDQEMDFSKYKVIILPDIITLDEELKAKIDNYLENGGKLIFSYKSGMDRNEEKFLLENAGVECIGDAEFSPDYVTTTEELSKELTDMEYVMYDKGLWVRSSADCKVLAKLWNPYFNRNYKHFCSHFQTPVEKESVYPAAVKNGDIIYFTHPIFSMYSNHGLRAYKQFVLNSLELILKDKTVITNAPTTAHITLNYQPEFNRYICHILHYIPERRYGSIDTIEDIIPLYNIELKVKLPELPVKIYCVPSMKELDFSMTNGYVNTIISRIDGHEMVVFELTN